MLSEIEGKIIPLISTSPLLLQSHMCTLWFAVEMRLDWSFGCVLMKGHLL